MDQAVAAAAPDRQLVSGSGPGPGPASVLQTTGPLSPSPLPRVTIRFCTQCKWMLRAAYFAQELLSTFGTSLGEVALQPTTGGIFTVEIYHYHNHTDASVGGAGIAASSSSPGNPASALSTGVAGVAEPATKTQHRVLWDRKVDGGFPETKELKRRVRDVIEPGRDLGHVDRDYHRNHNRHPEKKEEDANKGPLAKGEEQGEATPTYSTIGNDATMAGNESQQQQQQQPPGPRWPQLSESRAAAQSTTAQGGQQASEVDAAKPEPSTEDTPPANAEDTDVQKTKTPKDLNPNRWGRRKGEAATDAHGNPIQDPRMPDGGNNMPVAPRVAPTRSPSQYETTSSRDRDREEGDSKTSGQEECEDCQ